MHALADCDQAGLEVLLVPRSLQDRRPRGILVRRTDGDALPIDGPGHSYGVVGKRLYVPVEAQFQPYVDDREWEQLLSDDCAAFIWHPVTGLVAYESRDLHTLADLVTVDPPAQTDWSLARPGLDPLPRLESITAELPATIEEVLAQARGDIGSLAKDIKNIPRTPGSAPGRAISDVGAWMLGPLAHAAHWMASHVPGDADSPTIWNKLDDWANRVLQQGANLWNARARELQRLFNMLDSDPDAGLKYAIPFGGGGGLPRGLSTPGARLTARDVNFNLSRLGGGGAADYWDVPSDVMARISAKYRALAEREIRLGRHRRAAYIFAELLNDLPAAAATLENGGHHREASVLYRDRLHRLPDAARCLEHAGLFEDAVEIREQLHQFEWIGDLRTKLDQPDLAEAAYRRAVEQSRAQGNYLDAARVLDQKLESPDEAVDTLDAAWPHATQAVPCVERAFELLARMGRHRDAEQRVVSLRDPEVPARLMAPLGNCLASVHSNYPDEAVRGAAAQSVLTLASRSLVNRHRDAQQLLKCLERIAPEDRLLARDCRRYQRPSRPMTERPRKATERRSQLRPIGTIQLPPRTTWVNAKSTHNGFYLVGYRSRELLVVRGAWERPRSGLSTVSWRSHVFSGSPVLIAVDEAAQTAVQLLVPGGPPLTQRLLEANSEFPTPRTAETPGWISDDVIGLDNCAGITWCLESPDFVLKGITRDGVTIANQPLELDGFSFEAYRPHDPVPLLAREREVYVGLGNRLLRVVHGVAEVWQQFEQPIRHLFGSRAHARSRVAVLFDTGGMVSWPGWNQDATTHLPRELMNPMGAFLHNGRLIILDVYRLLTYDTSGERLTLVSEVEAPVQDVLAILPAGRTNAFGLLTAASTLHVYQSFD